MSKIDVAAIIEQYGLNKVELASLLFPDNKFASMALTRIIKGDAYLNSEQLSVLGSKLGVSVDSLYNDRKWGLTSNGGGVLKFETGDYEAELDIRSWITKIYHKKSLKHETVLHNGALTLEEYINKLEILINQ